MIKPDVVGSKAMFFNPGVSTFTAAELALIDGSRDSAASNYLPYAHSATVRTDYDSRRFCIDAEAIAADTRVSFGLFLTPENEKGNMMFQVSGQCRIYTPVDNGGIIPSFFFGRKATNNTVVSSKAGANNALAVLTLLPPTAVSTRGSYVDEVNSIDYAIETTVLAENDYTNYPYVWCFGVALDNADNSDITVRADCSLAVRKHGKSFPVYLPAGV